MSRDKDRNVNKPLKFRQNLYFAIGIIKEAKPVIGRSVLLSAAGVVLTAGITGLFIHLILKLPLLESLLTASVIGSTDAASVFGILRSKNLNLKENTAPPNAEMQQLLARMDGMQMEIDILKETINVLKKTPASTRRPSKTGRRQ